MNTLNKTVGICKACGREFTGNKGRQWCDNTCRMRQIRRQAASVRIKRVANIKTCPTCNCEFESGPRRTTYCCRLCRAKDFGSVPRKKYIRFCIPNGRCVVCDTVFNKASTYRYCCDECERIALTKTCRMCGITIECTQPFQQFCTPACQAAHHAAVVATPKVTKVCDECNQRYLTGYSSSRFCSLLCCRRNHKRKRRAMKRQAYVEPVGLGYLIKRDACICQICHTPVDLTAKAPDPNSPSLDHIVPLAKGGKHSKENCQLAHFLCNAIKGATVSATSAT